MHISSKKSNRQKDDDGVGDLINSYDFNVEVYAQEIHTLVRQIFGIPELYLFSVAT